MRENETNQNREMNRLSDWTVNIDGYPAVNIQHHKILVFSFYFFLFFFNFSSLICQYF